MAPQATKKKEDLKNRWQIVVDKAVARAGELRAATSCIVLDPQFQMWTISTASGAVVLSSVGGAFGLASGIVVGGGAGILPAFLTFGLSVPAGAIVGSGAGLCMGATAGALGGGVASGLVYKYRIEIKNGVVFIKRSTCEVAKGTAEKTREKVHFASGKLAESTKTIYTKVSFITCNTSKKALKVVAVTKSKAIEMGTDKAFQVTSASAVAGSAVGSVLGGVAGTVAGAAVGVVPALFTFGLSVPVAATIGFLSGVAVGGTSGAISGGAVGYSGYTRRKEIKSGAQQAWTQAYNSAEYVKLKAADSAIQVRNSVRSIVGGSTGGTA